MSESQVGFEVWLLAAAACIVGPGAAFLHESGWVSLGPDATLWPVGFIVVGASAGLFAGVRIASRVSRTLGAIVSVPNLIVLGFYGFLLLFFGMGGSR